MPFADPNQRKPWPIRALNRIGVENDDLATLIILVTVGILLFITLGLYADILSTEPIPAEPIDEATLEEIQQAAEAGE